MPRPSMLDAAMTYARQGFRVHPLRPGTKVPMLAAWQTEATTSIEAIATWWGATPDANVGIATGAESDLWVLDIDTGHGPDAAVSLAKLTDHDHQLPDTTEVTTPSGGTHLWFRWPKGEGTWRNTNALGKGIDVRAEGGQVAVWPSVLADGSRYRRPHGDRVRVPRWLAEAARHREPDNDGIRVNLAELTDGTATAAQAYGQRAIAAAITDLQALGKAAVADWQGNRAAYTGPSWDDATFDAACRLFRLAHTDWAPLGEGDAVALVREHAPTDAGFSRADHDRIIKSARASVGADAAVIPANVLNPLPLLDVPTGKPGAPAALDPDAYFDKAGIRTADVARAVDEDDLAIGSDGGLWRYEGGVFRPDDDIVTRRCAALLGNKWRAGFAATINQRVRLVHPLPRLGDEPHDAYLNVRNGMLDWRTGLLIPHSSAFRSTVQLPIVHDPKATCPLFDAWVGQVVADGDEARLLEVVGYMLAPGNPLQQAVLLFGTGGNGKGTLIRTLRAMIGSRNTSSVTLKAMAEGKYETADLLGKQANLAGDIDPKYLRDTATFKALTGGDVVQAQRKYGQPFDFTCHATPLFSANELWRSSDTSRGYLRRWTVLPMMQRVSGELDEAALFAEAPGILNRVLPYLRELMARRAFSTSLTIDDLNERFAEQADLVRTWLAEDDAVIDAEPGITSGNSWRLRTEIYARFKHWADDNGHGTMSSTRFYERLRHLGYEPAQQFKQGRGFWGITLISSAGGLVLTGVSLPPSSGGQA